MTMKARIDAAASLLDDRQEARRAMRIETSGLSSVGQEANVTIHNLSSAGLLIETDLPLKVGDCLAVDLPETGPVEAEIVWKSERLYGCAFAEALRVSHEANITGASDRTDLRLDGIGGEAFGIALGRLRRAKGLTLADVADALKVSKPTVWAWEKGKARPLPERLDALAEVLGAPREELATIAHGPSRGAKIIEDCRSHIARAFSVSEQSVRIMIEL